MPDTILKRWNGSAFEELYPKTTVGQISASGTPGSTTFLRGDGQWQIPATQPHTHVSADITDLKSNLKFLYIYGKAESAITKGQAVQFAGVQGDHILMKPAVPSEINANPDYFIGLAESTLATNDFGYILTQGELVNVNTSTYTAGNILWFASAGSTAGALTATEPTNSNARIQVASVNKVNATEGILFVRINFVGTEIEDIVASGTPSSSTFLRGDGQWITPSGTGDVVGPSSSVANRIVTFNGTTGKLIQDSGLTSSSFAAASHTHTYGDLTGTVPTWNQNTTGNAATATNVAYSGLTGTVPTWNQNTTGNAATATQVIGTVSGTNSIELVRGNMGDNDQARILVSATGSNAGYLEIATADDANEPIYVRQYTGVFTTLNRTLTLLDGSGNTVIPQSLYIGGSTNSGRFYADEWGLKVGTDNGHIQFGPANTSHAHIYTDRPNFYFNKDLLVLGSTVIHSGTIGSQSVNYASTAGSATDSTKLPLAGGTIDLNFGNTSRPITFNTAQTYTGPYLRGNVQSLQRGYYTDQYTIWDAGNDGAGSGLDADLLDGIQSSSFVQTTGTQTIDGQKTFSSSVRAPDGAVGTPGITFSNDTNTGFYRSTADQIRVALNGVERIVLREGSTSVGGITFNTPATSGTFAMEFRYNGVSNSGEITVSSSNTTSYVTSSDYRLKKDVVDMDGPSTLSRIMRVKPREFTWLSDGKRTEGFIAHELQEEFPDAVTGIKDATIDFGNILDSDGNIVETNYDYSKDLEESLLKENRTWVKVGTRNVNQGTDTSFMVAALVKSIQEQQRIIESQSSSILALKQLLVSKGIISTEE
jgi:hypothetical protein